MVIYFLGKQHSTLEANSSRLVTKIRWVIESANGRIKRWKYFSNVLINNNFPFINDDLRNICAIINRFRPQLASTNDEEHEDLYRKMVITSRKENPFVEIALGFSKRILNKNKKLDPLTISFPVLTEEYIEALTFGVYQLKQARSYTFEHLDENGNYMFEIYEEVDTFGVEKIVHIKLNSRHQSQTKHDAWIHYNPNLKLTEGQNPILNWYCTCKTGARIFGMCAHIVSVLWFLGYARYNLNLNSKRKCDLFLKLCLDASRAKQLLN